MQRNQISKGRPSRLRRFAWIAVLAMVTLGLTACGDEDIFGGATIESMTITPDTIQRSDTGMTDEFFTVSLSVSGFSDPIDADATEVFLEANGAQIEAVPQSIRLSGNQIVLENIAKTWVGGLEPGTYGVGASVQTVAPEGSTRPSEQVTQRDLATIEILGGATIVSMTITPDTIQLSDTGMTDEFFTVSLSVSGFSDPIDADATEVFLEANGAQIEAVPRNIRLSGNQIVLEDIAKTWAGGLEPGTYGVGASVQTVAPEGSTRPSEQVTQRDLATIEIAP